MEDLMVLKMIGQKDTIIKNSKKLRKTAIGVHINYQNMLKLIGFVSGNKYN